MEKRLTEHGLSERTLTVLAHFRSKETGQRAITEALGIDRTVTVAVLGRLCKKKLIVCTQAIDQTLGIPQLYKITPAGAALLVAVDAQKGQAALRRSSSKKDKQSHDGVYSRAKPAGKSTPTTTAYPSVMDRPAYKSGDGEDCFMKSL